MLQDRYPLAGKLVLAIISVLQTATAFASNATTTFPSQATMAAACTIPRCQGGTIFHLKPTGRAITVTVQSTPVSADQTCRLR